jgi:YidC/Oxa1 family membrane protein insertase
METSCCSLRCSRAGIAQRPAGLAAARPLRRHPRTAAHASLHAVDLASSLASLELAAHHYDGAAALRHLLSLADAAAAVAPAAAADAGAAGGAAGAQDNGWLTPLVQGLETVLQYIQSNLDKVHTPYSYGWSIVALVALVKAATFPLSKQQVESQLSVAALKPKLEAIKAKYGEDKDAVSRETSALYEKAGVNPLAGCLPTVATIPIFIGLYRSLTDVALQGQLDNQGFYWIPSLAGPTSMAAQRAGTGLSWLYPLVDGAPPVGWELAGRYLALPAALVVAQYISSAIITPPQDPEADNAAVTKALMV